MILIIILLIIDIAVDNYTVSILSRCRGVMRLFYLPIILENIQSHLKHQRFMNYTNLRSNEDPDKSTVEKVIQILLELTEKFEDPEVGMIMFIL